MNELIQFQPVLNNMEITPILKEHNLFEITQNFSELAEKQFITTTKALEPGVYLAVVLKQPRTSDDIGSLKLMMLNVTKAAEGTLCICEGHFDWDFDGWNIILGYKKIADFGKMDLTLDMFNEIKDGINEK